MMFHRIPAVASAVAGGAAEAPMTPSPARTATSAAARRMDHLRAMSAPLPSAHPCYGLPLSCSACSKSLSARNARSAGPSCTCLPMLTSSLHQTPSFEPVFPSEHGEEPPLEGGSAYDGPRLSFST